MKKVILNHWSLAAGLAIIGLGFVLLCSLGGCASVPRGAVFTWEKLTPGRWEAHVTHPRCPGCPPQTNVVWCPPTWGWKPVNN